MTFIKWLIGSIAATLILGVDAILIDTVSSRASFLVAMVAVVLTIALAAYVAARIATER